jgi:exodeoxyribonuclease VII small subunit
MTGELDVTETRAELELPFEAAVERLERLVSAMESGSLTLDECLAHFEEAVALSRGCAARLDAAEKRLKVLHPSGEITDSELPPWEATESLKDE